MKELWIIYSSYYDQEIENSATKMQAEALKNGINSELKYFQYFKSENGQLFYKNEVVKDLPKVAFIRCHELWLIEYLENNNVKVINSHYTTKTCRDKWLTHQVVETLNIEQPKTFLLNNHSFNDCVNLVELPFVLKYRHGAQGNNVFLIKNEEEFNIAKNTILENKDYIIQECIDNSYGRDIRAYIVGDNIMGACKRESEVGFMSNLAQGGKSYHYEMTDLEAEKALKIAKALKGDIISVDFLLDDNKLIFCEANTNAGFASFNYLGYPTREIMMKYIKTVIERKK